MKTRELIDALAADATVPTPLWNRRATILISGGLIFSALIFLIFLGIRPDMSVAISDPHVIFKFLFSGSVIVFTGFLTSALLKPGQDLASTLKWIALPFTTLVIGVIGQMMTSPAHFLLSGLIGRYPDACLRNIPILAAGPLICLMLIGRRGAPIYPQFAGLIIGTLSGGLGALLYALHCPDDSALFVATWYSLAILITSLIGLVVGARVLRW